MTANGQPTRLVPRYLGQRLDGTLEEFHRALAYLAADTCQRGRCHPNGSATCGKHQQRRQRERPA